jgi:diguanylate cyclase (GGDEF)-like protein
VPNLDRLVSYAGRNTVTELAALGTLPPSALERRTARLLIVMSAVILLASVPFARVKLAPVPGFVSVYESALIVNDLVTAALLIGQFMVCRTRAMRILVCGYAFTGLIAIFHLLSFPGLFAQNGLLGGDAQTTAWLYMFWHAGFPLCVLAYAGGSGGTVDGSVLQALGRGLGIVAVAVAGFAALATAQVLPLPAIMDGNHYTPVMIFVVGTVWLLSGAAFVAVWRRSSRSVLDLWLAVVMSAWVCEIALSAVFNGGRFDLGFYLGRIFGLLAASFVLVVLLIENGWLHARLVHAAGELKRLMSADPLTGIANRRTFDDVVLEECRRAQRHGSPLSLLMIDVDHFKAFNDCYGHVAGDDCLRRVAEAVRGFAQRAGEVSARIGGEEFAVLLPGTEPAKAAPVAEALRVAVEATQMPHDRSPVAPTVTVSVGVAGVSDSDPTTASPRWLMEAADAALYVAKLEGRNRVHVAASAVATARADVSVDATNRASER